MGHQENQGGNSRRVNPFIEEKEGPKTGEEKSQEEQSREKTLDVNREGGQMTGEALTGKNITYITCRPSLSLTIRLSGKRYGKSNCYVFRDALETVHK